MARKKSLFGGIDVGSSSIKSAVIDSGTRRVIETSRHRYKGTILTQQSVEVGTILREFRKRFDHLAAEGVSSIALSCMAPIMILVDSNFEPLLSIPYNSLLGSEFFSRLSEFDFKGRTYNTPNVQMFPQKTMWVEENRPDIMKDAAYIVDLNSFLFSSVAGNQLSRPVQDEATAVEWGLVDASLRTWWKELTNRLKVTSKLPKLVKPEFGIETEGIRLCIGTVDTMASALGAVGMDERRIFISNGSTLCAGFVSKKPVLTDTLYCDLYFSGHHLIDGCNSQYSTILDFAKRILGTKIDIDRVGNEPSHVVFIPYLSGERCPLFNTRLRGGFYGFDTETTRKELEKSVAHSLAYLSIDMIGALAEISGGMKEVVAGGGQTGELIASIVSSVTGMNYSILDYDPGSIGAAFIAMKSSGVIESYPRDACDYIHGGKRTYSPDSSLMKHKQAYAKFTELRRRLKNMIPPGETSS
jgi:sugar (pentulose or hexulose) kinase